MGLDLPRFDRGRSAMRLAGSCAVALVLAVLACGAQTQATAAGANGNLRVAFLRGEQLARVARPGTTPTDAVRALIVGPTAAERARGLRTYFEPGTKLLGLSRSGR